MKQYLETYEKQIHLQKLISVDGQWSSWTEWSGCSTTCGPGTIGRTRTCTQPSPQNGGQECIGNEADEQICNPEPCPIDGKWSRWSNWSSCSEECGDGIQTRNRSCDSPVPQHGGLDCGVQANQTQSCFIKYCPSKLNIFATGNILVCDWRFKPDVHALERKSVFKIFEKEILNIFFLAKLENNHPSLKC